MKNFSDSKSQLRLQKRTEISFTKTMLNRWEFKFVLNKQDKIQKSSVSSLVCNLMI